ncbi:hypothetical protein [Salinisphaera sp. T31B1]|uniref:phage tail terminator protein n=1 Tax=Salinisphaera sp. T31B1 TaxID=727963 RepID=UPI00333EFC71
MQNPDIQPALIERLKDRCSDVFAVIDDAWNAPAIEQLYETTPAAYVFLQAEGPDRNADPETNCPRQRVTFVYAVHLVVNGEQFRDVAHRVREALFGWGPTEQHLPMANRGGERMAGGRSPLGGLYIEYQQRWSVDTWLRNNNPSA